MSSFEKSLGEVNGQLKMVIDLLNKGLKKAEDNGEKIADLLGRTKSLEARIEKQENALEERCVEVNKRIEEHVNQTNKDQVKKLEKEVKELVDGKRELKKGVLNTIISIIRSGWEVISAVIIGYLLYKTGWGK